MTALPPNPDPASTPGLESGGGVLPGETPPDSEQTSNSMPDPTAGRNLTPRAVIAFVAIGLFVALFLACAVYLVVRMVG